MKTALIAGATGLTGSHLLNELLNDDRYGKVYSLTRKKTGTDHPKLTEIIFDYNKAESYDSIPPVDETFCCLGTTIAVAGSQDAFARVDRDYPVALAKATLQKGCKKFLMVSALGANKTSSVFYNRIKGQTEELICAMPFDTIIIARPSLLLGNRKEFRIGERIGKIFAVALSPLLSGSFRKYRAIQSAVVAIAMLRLANSTEKGIQIVESDRLQELMKSTLKEERLI